MNCQVLITKGKDKNTFCQKVCEEKFCKKHIVEYTTKPAILHELFENDSNSVSYEVFLKSL